jgi:hypothetical protein
MMFNATFNNISVISWRSVLFLDEIGVPREKKRNLLVNIPSLFVTKTLNIFKSSI